MMSKVFEQGVVDCCLLINHTATCFFIASSGGSLLIVDYLYT